MKKLALILAALGLLISPMVAFAKDVHVRGYYRKDGTYVQPHVRSAPDGVRWNNYGPSGGVDMMNGRNRDADGDGTPNYQDRDDNNNGIQDDYDRNQYGR
jgi:hypothetical protein